MDLELRQLILAAGGEVVGKVRLQKMVYLLDQMGMNSGLSYDYHHYGPYSAGLADQVDEEVVVGRITEGIQRRASDGVPYSVFRAEGSTEVGSDLGELSFEDARAALTALGRRSATVLELAATIHWLAFVEGVADWRIELLRRKGVKAADGRDRQALDLLSELKLAPV